ncbi:hypothetical protein SARC_00058 [Sphaeroforma arctica JP610]|uniref:Uncharacterized protein n=1 Tax=Sphaeroforma arctica JP610 TaxID=667725 RepID=A0A0L0GG49_9EUKA|nr:hypothetical protein SARC_00058 [Sphaeroforma arctica JP610]KNC87801.1 hypothetical protein SARC_00058 [Sphaeroforma arctica JP610]|eukprot:XP_014161703.1 hypothetical protein SARC_00058 [Sphaeroforma arctica JP610]
MVQVLFNNSSKIDWYDKVIMDEHEQGASKAGPTRQQLVDEAFAKSYTKKNPANGQKDSDESKDEHADIADGASIVELEDKVEGMNLAESAKADSTGKVDTPSGVEASDDTKWSEEEIKEAFEKADSLKVEGNIFFKMKEYDSAINLYTECIESCPAGDSRVAVYFCNRAACYLALEEYNDAVDDCTEALSLNKEYVKALVRRAQGYEKQDKLEDALEDFKKAVELDPTTRVAVEGGKRLSPLVTERQEKLKEEMMGKLKDLGNTVLGKFGMSLDAFKMVQQPDGSYSVGYNP